MIVVKGGVMRGEEVDWRMDREWPHARNIGETLLFGWSRSIGMFYTSVSVSYNVSIWKDLKNVIIFSFG